MSKDLVVFVYAKEYDRRGQNIVLFFDKKKINTLFNPDKCQRDSYYFVLLVLCA